MGDLRAFGFVMLPHILQRLELVSIPSITMDEIVRMSLFFHSEVLTVVAHVVASQQRALLMGQKNETKLENVQQTRIENACASFGKFSFFFFFFFPQDPLRTKEI